VNKRQKDMKTELERQLKVLLRKKYDPKDDERIAELQQLLKNYQS
jgi:hypothetical protein